VAERDEDREERLRKHLVDIMHEQALQSARAVGKDRSCRVCELEVLGNHVSFGEDDRPALTLAGIDDDR
jgi:hypothetical protein